jgi:hypothetical protein
MDAIGIYQLNGVQEGIIRPAAGDVQHITLSNNSAKTLRKASKSP